MTSMITPLHRPAPRAQAARQPRAARPRSPARLRRPAGLRRPLRLTTRGRLVAVLALALLAFAVVSLGRVVTIAAIDGAPPPHETVVVEQGQTLWQIAREIAPGVDPRITVGRLIEINGLDGAEVRVGRQLVIPAEGR
jgi:Tfp pilus assembly protein FimV